ncbi:hypothetical protein [Fulvivirga ligni]|uniref:hypothetical protein n=1 Tax=Fulvivirga ligni TaxID=2904246 RepID=UPI001F2D28BD|nr:hypothetical protein [Fulvivirga ligni]UII22743.1 hypothetical protein LVD16_05825 [Fulvivirga ligni]
MKSGEVYLPSSKFGTKAIVILVIEVLTIVPLLAIAYSYAINFMPVIYLNFVTCAAFGVALGFLSFPVVKYGHIVGYRNELLCLITIWFFAMIFQWSAFMAIVIKTSYSEIEEVSFTSSFFYYLLHPVTLVQDMYDVSLYGLWSIGSITVKDFGLWAVWIIEAIIIFIAMWQANKKWSIFPYSHVENNWFPENKLPRKMPLHRGFGSFLNGLKDNNMEAFTGIAYSNIDSREFTEVVIYATRNDTNAYLAFYNQQLKTGKDGKKEEEYKRASDFYCITPEQKDILINHFS